MPPSFSPHYSQKMQQLQQNHRVRTRKQVQRLADGYILKDGKKLLSFSDNDYLGLCFHPKLQQAALAAMTQFGTGAAASRLITGNHPLYAECEKKLAAYKGTEDALVFGSGYLTNIGVIPALVGKGDLVVADRLIHASLIDAIGLSGATLKRFHHNDAEHATQLLQQHRDHYKQCIMVTEGVFSMDGDLAPVAELMEIATQHHAILVVDDAHGFGVLENSFNPTPSNLLQIGTFSKAAGSYGGYVCGSSEWIDYLLNHARSAIYTTGLPPATVAANNAAIEIIRTSPALGQKALQNAQYFCELLALPKAESCIVPIIIGEAAETLEISKAIEAEGVLVQAIRPPTVPPHTSRLRFTFSATHQQKDIEKLAAIVSKKTAGLSPALS